MERDGGDGGRDSSGDVDGGDGGDDDDWELGLVVAVRDEGDDGGDNTTKLVFGWTVCAGFCTDEDAVVVVVMAEQTDKISGVPQFGSDCNGASTTTALTFSALYRALQRAS